MRRASRAFLVAAVVLPASCSRSRLDWKERAGPGFVVTAPSEARHATKTIASSPMDEYEYGTPGDASLLVAVSALPAHRSANGAIVALRDHFAAKNTISREEVLPMGDAPGLDVWGVRQTPLGEMRMRYRIVVQDQWMYQVIATNPVGNAELDAAADRFAESFKLARPSADPLAKLEATMPGTEVRRSVGVADETGWYSARSVNGKFSMQAPGVLNEVESDIEAGRMYVIATQQMPQRIKFGVTCIVSDEPRSPDEFVAKVGPVDVRRDRELQGRPAVEVEMGNRSALGVFEPGRMCMATVEPESKTTPRPSADVRRFFDSFRLED